MEQFGLTRKKFATIAVLLALAGILIYLPAARINFYEDDVDFYSEAANTMESGGLLKWVFRFANGHLAVIPSIAYYLNYQYFDRSVALWHIMGFGLRAAGIVSVFYILLYFLRRWEIAAFMAFIYASSVLYRHIYVHTSSFNHLCAVTFTFLSLALLCVYMERGPGRGWGLYAGSVASGIAAVISSAMGVVVFPLHVVFVWAAQAGTADIFEGRPSLLPLIPSRGKRAPYIMPVALSALTFGLFWAMGTKGTHEGHLNLLFGLQETLSGIASRTLRDLTPKKNVSYALAGWALVNLIIYRRRLGPRYILMSMFALIVPLLLNTSFREDFNDPGRIGKYHSISVLGMLLLVGGGLSAPYMKKVTGWFRAKPAGWAMLAALALVLSLASYNNLSGTEDCAELRQIENLLGMAAMEYSSKYETKTIAVPVRDIAPPCFPDKRPLINLVRYCAPPGAGFSFIPAQDDNSMIGILESDPKYIPVLDLLRKPE